MTIDVDVAVVIANAIMVSSIIVVIIVLVVVVIVVITISGAGVRRNHYIHNSHGAIVARSCDHVPCAETPWGPRDIIDDGA